MSLQFEATLAPRGFSLHLEVAPGDRVAVLGPNGAGKSTLLQLLSGVLAPDSGRAQLAGTELFDISAGRFLASHRRGIALLAQDPLLFPHLSVLDNVAYPLRVTGVTRQAASRQASDRLAEVDAEELAPRRPRELSGGEAQRVAIARALASSPALLLLDEPLAALDVSVAPLVRRVLRRVMAQRSSLIVTHDLLDALLLSDRVVVIEDGRIAESGPTAQVLQHPRTRFTARLAGLNLVTGTIQGDQLSGAGISLFGTRRLDGIGAGQPGAAAFSPTDVAVHLAPPGGSPRNNLVVRVSELEPHGDLVRVRTRTDSGLGFAADVTPASVAELDLYPGREVVLTVKASAVSLYPL